jgi:hypothetical protein
MISEALSLGLRPSLVVHGAMTPASQKFGALLNAQARVVLYPKLPASPHQSPQENQEERVAQTLCSLAAADQAKPKEAPPSRKRLL